MHCYAALISVSTGHCTAYPGCVVTLDFCAGNHRKLRVTAQPNVSLTLEHVPHHCRRAKTILLGPLTPTDLDAAAFVHQELGMLAVSCIACTAGT